ncbi:hypothetical protein ABZY36_32430 [Streptomyces sp. NPDC006627]|uniref:hypothetical protein n=1 Tax=Streptomyces sp. NPDC006627 TaxID=3154679 RepID=UPI0033B91E36
MFATWNFTVDGQRIGRPGGLLRTEEQGDRHRRPSALRRVDTEPPAQRLDPLGDPAATGRRQGP